MKYCPYCGSGLGEDMVYCPRCGRKYQGPAAPAGTGEAAGRPPEPSVRAERGIRTWTGVTAVVVAAAIAAAAAVVLFRADRNVPAAAPLPERSETAPELPETPDEPPAQEPAGLQDAAGTGFLDDPDAMSALSASVVMLKGYDMFDELCSYGSGFIAYRDDIVVTNYHAIARDVFRVDVLFEDGRTIPATHVEAYAREKDVAFLKLASGSGRECLSFGDPNRLVKGERIAAIGSPMGRINSFSDGIISGLADNLIQFTAAISYGSSGGVLLNQKGEVVGVTGISFDEGQNVNFAVPIDVVDGLWKNADHIRTVTMEEFYNFFEHVLTVDQVLKNREELAGRSVTVRGVVSSSARKRTGGRAERICSVVVADSSEALGYDTWDEALNEKIFDVDHTRVDEAKAIEIISENSGGAVQLPLKPGTVVKVTGEVRYTSGPPEGSPSAEAVERVFFENPRVDKAP